MGYPSGTGLGTPDPGESLSVTTVPNGDVRWGGHWSLAGEEEEPFPLLLGVPDCVFPSPALKPVKEGNKVSSQVARPATERIAIT